MDRMSVILKKYWGYDTFRPLQREIIDRVLAGQDVVALLPTGGGKSLTYQLPAVAMQGVAIVITPLIALMRDQVEALRARGIKAVMINSSMRFHEIDIALDNCVYGDVKLLYIAPERIDTLVFRQRLKRMNVSMVAIDEAHCISQWGYDFRPSYLRIATLRESLPEVPFIALTATATDTVLKDIVHHAALRNAQILRASFARPGLSFVVRWAENKYEQILRVATNVQGSGIVYCRTRAQSEQVADFLRSRGCSADFYHAGLDYRLRSIKQTDWMQGRTRVVVATNAFGMGIDKADVRFVVHLSPPDSIEAYYQEAGRAGRDGRKAWAVMLYNEQDRTSMARRLDMEYPPITEIKRIYEALFNYLQISIGGGKDEIYDFDLMAFAVHSKTYSLTAYNAIKILELGGYMTLTDETDHATRIMFRVSRDELYRFRVDNQNLDGFLKIVLRTYTGFFTDFVAVDEALLAHASGFTQRHVSEMLLSLSRAKILRYIPRRRSPLIVFHEERLPTSDVLIPAEIYSKRREQSALRAESVEQYAQSVNVCRSLILQNYFDERATSPCGVCDICLAGAHRGGEMSVEISMEDEILDKLKGVDTWDLRSLVASTKGRSTTALNSIRHLLASGKIEQRANGTIVISRAKL